MDKIDTVNRILNLGLLTKQVYVYLVIVKGINDEVVDYYIVKNVMIS
jgi:hypothetical protein